MNHTTKLFTHGAAIAAVILAGAVTPVFAVSDPADDTATYGYTEGRAAYNTRMAESHPWYDNTTDEQSATYSFRSGLSKNEARTNAFSLMPTEPNLTDEELAAFFEKNGIGEGSAYSNGAYDESAKKSYGYAEGEAAYNVYHKQFETK